MWDATNCTNNKGLPWDISNLYFLIFVYMYVHIYKDECACVMECGM